MSHLNSVGYLVRSGQSTWSRNTALYTVSELMISTDRCDAANYIHRCFFTLYHIPLGCSHRMDNTYALVCFPALRMPCCVCVLPYVWWGPGQTVLTVCVQAPVIRLGSGSGHPA